MRILDFSTYMACLWDTKIVDSHKHALYVKKSRILMKIFTFAKFSIPTWIVMQKKHYFCTYLNAIMIILDFGTYTACLWDTKIGDSHKHARLICKKIQKTHENVPFRQIQNPHENSHAKKHYFCSYLNVIMIILDFGTYTACLWDTKIRDSPKHAIYVPKSRILMKIFTFAKFRILMRILMQK